MDRISRALELARAQRERATEEAARRAKASPTPPQAAQQADAFELPEPVAAVPLPLNPQDPGHSDTQTFRSPLIELDAARLERERILAPGAPGFRGGPYKMLRTQVLQRMAQLGANSLAVLSPTAGAGKTLTAINLAIAIAAEEGRTVLLVDLDLRNPSVHKRLGFIPQLGIEECVESGRPVQHAMVKIVGYERLTILPARARIEHSSELLTDQRMIDVIAEMRSRYANRILLFDVPPVLQADDALAFTRSVQAGLVVVGEGRTKREDVARTIELLRELKIVGTVLNGSRETARTHY
jgi:Mrp family chromosome partitioning ATPase